MHLVLKHIRTCQPRRNAHVAGGRLRERAGARAATRRCSCRCCGCCCGGGGEGGGRVLLRLRRRGAGVRRLLRLELRLLAHLRGRACACVRELGPSKHLGVTCVSVRPPPLPPTPRVRSPRSQ